MIDGVEMMQLNYTLTFWGMLVVDEQCDFEISNFTR